MCYIINEYKLVDTYKDFPKELLNIFVHTDAYIYSIYYIPYMVYLTYTIVYIL